MKSPAIKAVDLSCCIDKTTILKELNFEIPRQSLTSIIGPSGSGKTTLLKTIAGFQAVCKGELFINGKLASKKGFAIAPDKRKLGMVFQDHALFPHLSVIENIKTGFKSSSSDGRHLERLIKKFHLSHLQNRHPHEISGGQQSRTALARALLAKPDILLLDEPFANLNQDLQIEVGIELVEILRQEKTTAIMVTHDQNDAMAISNHIVMLKNGRHIQSGSPQSLYSKPATREVASFLTRGSFMKARYMPGNAAQTSLGIVDVDLPQNTQFKEGEAIDIWLHPEDLIIDANLGYEVRIEQQVWRPLDLLIKVRTKENQQLLLKTDQQMSLTCAKTLRVRLNTSSSYSAFA